MAEQEKCPECGRPIVESLQAFEAQWETHTEVCFPHVNFGGSELCTERKAARLESELVLARKALAAAEEMRKHVNGSERGFAACDEFDAAMAEVRKGSTDE